MSSNESAAVQAAIESAKADLLRDQMAQLPPMQLGTYPLVPGGLRLNISGIPCGIKKVKLPNRMDLKPETNQYPQVGFTFGLGDAAAGHPWFVVVRVQKHLIVCKKIPQAKIIKMQQQKMQASAPKHVDNPFYKTQAPK